jgi:hypothetical protein
MMRLIITFMCILLIGCTDAKDAATIKIQGDARQVFFKECMDLATKMPRQSDDDVSDIISECGQQSYYLTNYIVPKVEK